MLEFIHMTATYSNAMLVAILPQVSEFAKKLELPIPQPITAAQVAKFRPSNVKNMVGGGLSLTNGYWFSYSLGYVDSFRAPNNPFNDENTAENWPRYAFGKSNITTNDAMVLARAALQKLGYHPESLGCDDSPDYTNGPFDTADGHHVPHYQMRWERYTSPDNPKEQRSKDAVKVDVNLENKSITAITVISRTALRPPPKIGMEPELESDYKKRISGKMFTRTNAPASVHPEKKGLPSKDGEEHKGAPASSQPHQ